MRTRSSKGWGQLPRTIARAFAGAKLNGSESRIVWAIVYKTIAFNKSEDEIPWSQLSDLTGIDQWNLTRPINRLLKKGVILRKGFVYGIQTDFSKWKIPSNQMVIKVLPSVSKELPSVSKELPSNQMDSRDLSKRAFQEKGLSASQRRKKYKEFLKGQKMMKEEIERSSGKKKEGSE